MSIKPVSASSRSRRSHSALGIMLMLCAMFMFSAGDTIAKFLTSTLHPVQIIWFRQLGLFVGVIILLLYKGRSILVTSQPGLQLLRGTLVVFSSLLFVYAVRYVQLADAVAASFVAPFFLIIAGALLLKEKMGLHRWIAVIVGFLGAIIVIRPGMGVVHPAAMLVVLAAALYAARQVIGRFLADSDKTITTITYTAITSSILISIPLPFFWQWPQSTTQWLLLVSMAMVASLGEILIIKALEVAETTVVAPIHYTLIVWGTIYGFLVFDDLPDSWTLIGTLIIVVAGIYTLRRESVR